MRRVFVLLVFGALPSNLFVPPTVSAQTVVGVQAGVNLATFSGEHPANFDHRTAVNVGAFLDLPLSGRIGLRVGAGYSGKGAETTFSPSSVGPDSWGKIRYRFGYVEVPVALRLRVLQGNRASADLLFGPAFSFKTGCEVEMDMVDPDWGHTTKCDDAGFDVRAMDLGARTGIGLEAQISESLRAVSEAHYSFGLRTVGASGDGVKNRGLSMSLGLAYPIG